MVTEIEECEFFKIHKLKEHSMNKVEVELHKDNIRHVAILFTGFRNGTYTTVYNNAYDVPYDATHTYYLKVLEELTTI